MTEIIGAPRVEESLAKKGDIERCAIIAKSRDDGKLLVDVLVKMAGERYAYQASYKVSRELLDQEKEVIDLFFDEMKKNFKDVLSGKKELTAIL